VASERCLLLQQGLSRLINRLHISPSEGGTAIAMPIDRLRLCDAKTFIGAVSRPLAQLLYR